MATIYDGGVPLRRAGAAGGTGHAWLQLIIGSWLFVSPWVLGFAAGGGLDVKWTDRISVRLVQADYLGTRYGDATQNNFRLSAGIVFHFGRK